MQMHSVETKVGITIWFAASMIAGSSSNPCLQMRVDVLDHHRGVIDQNTDREREAARAS